MISESDSSAGHLKQTNCKSHHHEILLSNFPWSYHGISDRNNWIRFKRKNQGNLVMNVLVINKDIDKDKINVKQILEI